VSYIERFSAMGTRIELHLFGAGDADALAAARRAIEAVDDALTIHRPSPTTALNAALMAGRSATIDDAALFDALVEIEVAHASTLGLFDPAAESRAGAPGWRTIRFDRDRALVEASQPVSIDFGGFGKGFALDRAGDILRNAGTASGFLSAGESSIAVIGEHPLGGAWPVAIPHPIEPGRMLIELELADEALSISATVGAGVAAPGRAAMVRPTDGAIVTDPRSAIVIDRRGARAEAMSTALIVATDAQLRRLVEGDERRRFLFTYPHEAPSRREIQE
jgi:thiamine biosynthesis lipoprotein